MMKKRDAEIDKKYGIGSAHHAEATKVKGFADGGIVTRPTRALIGEAGQSEAVVPLNEFYAKIDQLIQVQQNVLLATKEGKNIYLDSNKVGTAQNMATTKI